MTNQTKWTIDEANSAITFKVRHLMIAHVKAAFKIFEASIYTIDRDFTTAKINLLIDASSITTGNANHDEHLKSADFFDVQNYKQIIFTSGTIGKPDFKGNHELWGELTIKGVTKNIKLRVRFGGNVNDPWENKRAGLTIIGKINRSDWGLIWNTDLSPEGLMVSEEITISCEVELTNKGQGEFTMQLDPASRANNISLF